MRSHYFVPVTLLPPTGGGAPALLIDGKLLAFGHATTPWSSSVEPGAAVAIVTVEWDANDSEAQDAFETTTGVTIIPPVWDWKATPAPAEAAEALTPLAAKAGPLPVSPQTFADFLAGCDRHIQRRLLPWP